MVRALPSQAGFMPVNQTGLSQLAGVSGLQNLSGAQGLSGAQSLGSSSTSPAGPSSASLANFGLPGSQTGSPLELMQQVLGLVKLVMGVLLQMLNGQAQSQGTQDAAAAGQDPSGSASGGAGTSDASGEGGGKSSGSCRGSQSGSHASGDHSSSGKGGKGMDSGNDGGVSAPNSSGSADSASGVQGQAPVPPVSAHGQQYKAKGTSYYPSKEGREGGYVDRKDQPLQTLQDYLAGKAPYVSVAMDPRAFPYGTKLRIPELEKKYGRPIEFRVVDRFGTDQDQGTRRIDICTANKQTSLDPTINSTLTLIPVQ